MSYSNHPFFCIFWIKLLIFGNIHGIIYLFYRVQYFGPLKQTRVGSDSLFNRSISDSVLNQHFFSNYIIVLNLHLCLLNVQAKIHKPYKTTNSISFQTSSPTPSKKEKNTSFSAQVTPFPGPTYFLSATSDALFASGGFAPL